VCIGLNVFYFSVRKKNRKSTQTMIAETANWFFATFVINILSDTVVVVATRFTEYSVNLCTRLFLKPSYSVLLNSVSKWFTQFYFYQEKIYKNRVIT